MKGENVYPRKYWVIHWVGWENASVWSNIKTMSSEASMGDEQKVTYWTSNYFVGTKIRQMSHLDKE